MNCSSANLVQIVHYLQKIPLNFWLILKTCCNTLMFYFCYHGILSFRVSRDVKLFKASFFFNYTYRNSISACRNSDYVQSQHHIGNKNARNSILKNHFRAMQMLNPYRSIFHQLGLTLYHNHIVHRQNAYDYWNTT